MKVFYIIFFFLLCYEWISIIKVINVYFIEGENSLRSYFDEGIFLSDIRKGINWVVCKKRNWIVLFEG